MNPPDDNNGTLIERVYKWAAKKITSAFYCFWNIQESLYIGKERVTCWYAKERKTQGSKHPQLEKVTPAEKWGKNEANIENLDNAFVIIQKLPGKIFSMSSAITFH